MHIPVLGMPTFWLFGLWKVLNLDIVVTFRVLTYHLRDPKITSSDVLKLVIIVIDMRYLRPVLGIFQVKNEPRFSISMMDKAFRRIQAL